MQLPSFIPSGEKILNLDPRDLPCTLDLTGDRGDQMETVNRPHRLRTILSDRGDWGDWGDRGDYMETRLNKDGR